MRRLRAWTMRVKGLFHTARRDRELDEEIESHLQLHAEDNVRRGMPPHEARRAAILQLGSAESLKEMYREQRGVPLLDHLVQDLRYAARTLRRSPGFTASAVLTVAFGVAGPTVTFSMMKAWILDPLPFADPDMLVDVRSRDASSGNTEPINSADFLDFRRGARSFEDLAAYQLAEVRVTGGDRAERVRAAQVTSNFFILLGAHAGVGRVFERADEQSDRPSAAVISHALWRERFATDPTIVGRAIRLNGQDHVIIGVLPEAFQFTLLGRIHIWRSLVFAPEDAVDRRTAGLVGLGRLHKGRTVDQAREELTRVAADLSAAHPDTNSRRGVRVLGLADEIRVHHDAGFLIPVLFAMVCCVLLIACVNVTNIMLARTSTRRQEMAVRLALGASRSRIVRQSLVEHVVLFVAASALGAAFAVYGTAWITDSIPYENRQFLRGYGVLSVDATVLVFALGVGAVAGAIFGWLPAWTGTRADVNVDLRDAARTTTGKIGTRLRGSLVMCEVALALAILISAGLLVQTARNIRRADVGFDPHDLLTFQLSLDQQQYRTPQQVRTFYERLIADLQTRPGVAGAAAGSLVPFGNIGGGTELLIDGQPDPAPSDTPVAALNQITPAYAATMRLRLERGRLVGAADGPDGMRVALVNRTLAAQHFGGRDPMGERLRLARGSNDFWTVVGIVGDVKNYDIMDQAEPQVYVPFAQQPSRQMMVVIRASGDPDTLAATVRASVAALDPAEPVAHLFTMLSLKSRVTGPYETISTFVTFFGALTLLLAGVGVYGVISYSFAQRTREIGIRMALGARRADVAVLVLKQVRTFLLAALAPGLALAWLLGGAMQAILVGVTPTDWRLYLGMPLALAAVAVLAALVPARRATAIDPMTALRYE